MQAALEGLLADAPDAPPVAEGFAFLGRVLYAYEFFAAAEESLAVALERVPEQFEWRHLRGLVRSARGDFAGAAKDFAAATAGTDAVAPPVRLGDAYLALGRTSEAREAYAEALRRNRLTPAAEYGLGRVEAAAGRPAEAARHFEAALSQQPSGSVAHEPLAAVYRALGDEERSRRHLAERGDGAFAIPDPVSESVARIQEVTALKTVEEMASRPPAVDGRATADGEPGFDETGFLDFVLERFGRTPEPVFKLRALLAELDRADGDRAGDAVGANVQRGRLRFALGGLLLRQGRDEEALGELETAATLAPTLTDARLQLADLHARRGRFAEAIERYDALLAIDPQDAAVLTHRAAARVNLAAGRAAGDPAAIASARADLERALVVTDDAETQAAAHDLLARLDLGDGRTRSAEEHYRRALDADPGHRTALAGLGNLLGRRGSYAEAAGLYRRLVAAEPGDATARMGEAVSLLLAGDYVKARERLEIHVAELPKDAALKARLARLLAACPDPVVRDGGRAVDLAQQAFAADPSAEAVETLAMAFAEAGDFEQARLWQRRLLSAGAAADSAARERWQQNLGRYESGRSCCAGQNHPPGGRQP